MLTSVSENRKEKASHLDRRPFEAGSGFGESDEPPREPGVLRPPLSGKSQVEIAQRAGKRDCADVGDLLRRIGLKGDERSLDLRAVVVHPFLRPERRLSP